MKIKIHIALIIVSILLVGCESNANSGIKSRWNISLPNNYTVLYEDDNFDWMDGTSYNIWKYDLSPSFEGIEWNSKKDTAIEAEVKSIEDMINNPEEEEFKELPEEYLLNFQKDYLFYKENKNSFDSLYLFYFEDDSLLYVIENLY